METEPLPHHPNIKQKEGHGLFCFMDSMRACGPDCMAYETPPNHVDFQDKQWAQCLLLVNAHRAGKHLVVLASCVGEVASTNKKVVADQLRSAQNTPSPPR